MHLETAMSDKKPSTLCARTYTVCKSVPMSVFLGFVSQRPDSNDTGNCRNEFSFRFWADDHKGNACEWPATGEPT